MIDAGGGPATRLTREPSDEVLPSWSRDGQWLYVASNRSGRFEIGRVPVGGGAWTPITTDGGFRGFESADGGTLYYMKGWESPLFARPSGGGPERLLLDAVSYGMFSVVPDGVYFAAYSAGDTILQFHDPESGESRVVGSLGRWAGNLSVAPDGQTFLYGTAGDRGRHRRLRGLISPLLPAENPIHDQGGSRDHAKPREHPHASHL